MNFYPLKWYLQERNPIGIAFDRYYKQRYATEKISGFSDNLSEFMVALEHCSEQHIEKFKRQADLYWSEIDTCTYVQYWYGQRAKKLRIKHSVLVKHLWEDPFDEYDDYLWCYKHTTYLRCFNEDNYHKGAIINIEKEGIELTPPSEAAWLELKRKYMKAIDLIEAGDAPEYDDLMVRS